jgi:uncharacterized protein (TIGR02246 family)
MLWLLITLLMLRATVAPNPAQELERLEQQLTDALVDSDIPTIESLWADDLIFVGTTGKPSSKAERLSGMNAPIVSEPKVAAAKNDQVKTRLYGQTAVVTLRSTWTTRANNRNQSDQYMTTHVWVKQRGRWRLVSAHVSKLTQ